jgi:hypothetical protein
MSATDDKAASSARPPNPDSTQQELISLFDLQLKVLADSYLSFFQERYARVIAFRHLSRRSSVSRCRKRIEEA